MSPIVLFFLPVSSPRWLAYSVIGGRETAKRKRGEERERDRKRNALLADAIRTGRAGDPRSERAVAARFAREERNEREEKVQDKREKKQR